MTDEELDEVRRILVGFEDVAMWCADVAAIAQRYIEAVTQHEPVPPEDVSRDLLEVAETIRYLESRRTEVGRVRNRIGIPPEPQEGV